DSAACEPRTLACARVGAAPTQATWKAQTSSKSTAARAKSPISPIPTSIRTRTPPCNAALDSRCARARWTATTMGSMKKGTVPLGERDSPLFQNPPILHRKETFLHPVHRLHAKFAPLMQEEEKAGLLQTRGQGSSVVSSR